MSRRDRFDLTLTRGPARRHYARAFGDTERAYPWRSLDVSRYPATLIERARDGWTENAFNEFCTGAVLGQLVTALAQARAPVDLWGLAASFAPHEALHVELCARYATQLGGGTLRTFEPASLEIALDPSLTPLQRANELMVRVCCVGEALSFPLLRGALRATTHPLTRAVLETIVRDEALHGRLGMHYLDWVAPSLTRVERDRLARAARGALEPFLSLFESFRASSARDGVTSEGFLLEHVHELGWMEASAYRSLAFRSIETCVRAPLARHGISLRV